MSRAEGPRTVVMFPGQGSQTREMRVAVDEYCPGLAETACRLVGTDVFERVNESMSCAQPAIYCAGLAGWRRLSRDLDSKADRALVFAGHSLGEITALAAAGSLDTEEGLELVARRGELMDEASAGEARGGMLAVVGSDAHRVARESGIEAINLANDNSPFQVVVSGPPEALAAAEEWARGCGLRTVVLPMRVAGHSAQMGVVASRFRSALESVTFGPPDVPVWSSSSVAPLRDPVHTLAEGIATPVRWRELLEELSSLGARVFLETGPGQVLSRLVRQTLPDAQTALGVPAS